MNQYAAWPGPVDLTGQRFERWLVIERASENRWLCRCDCGTSRTVDDSNLKHSLSKSCGCLQRETTSKMRRTHGHAIRGFRPPEYRAWVAMRDRCRNPNNPRFSYYGGRGISVCARWDAFENFLADMGLSPTMKHSLDRFPYKNGKYEPINCLWATIKQQNRNTRANKLNEHDAARIRNLSLAGFSTGEIAAEFGVTKDNTYSVTSK